MDRDDYEFLVAVHEMIEQHICRKRGITQEIVDEFDTRDSTVNGKHAEDPGCDPKAPYHKEHMFGMRIERLVAKELGVDWKKYEKAFEKLPEWKKKHL